MRLRSIRHGGRRKKTEPVDVDMTSLMDILISLLFFLAATFHAAGTIDDVPLGIVLPFSKSKVPSDAGVIVQVSPSKIWIDKETVVDMANVPQNLYDHGGLRIIPLYNKLVERREIYQNMAKAAAGAAPFSGVVNLVVDKTIKYDFLKKLMYTSAEAGFRKYKFIVMAED